MAVKYLEKTNIRLQVDMGLNAEGKPVFVNRSLPPITDNTLADDIMEVVVALGNLMAHPVVGINEIETKRIS